MNVVLFPTFDGRHEGIAAGGKDEVIVGDFATLFGSDDLGFAVDGCGLVADEDFDAVFIVVAFGYEAEILAGLAREIGR